METENSGAFWTFSVTFYKSADVQAACLDLQDNFGADVNVALFMLFQGSLGHVLAKVDVDRIDAEIAAWRDQVIRPLRHMRRLLKAGQVSVTPEAQENFRNALKALELASEKTQQFHMEGLETTSGPSKSARLAARANLETYARTINIDNDNPPLTVLLARFDNLYGTT